MAALSSALAALETLLPTATLPAALVNTPEPDIYTATSPASVYAAQATAPTSNDDTSFVPGIAFDRIIIIWGENTDYDKAALDPNLAYLAEQGITLTNYTGVTHPSEPNYVSAIGGDNFGMDNDDFNQIATNVSTVIDLLEAAGISWGTYEEDMPYTGYEGYSWVNQVTKANDYVRKHNPPVIYDANTTPERLSYQKNTTRFAIDLANNAVPQWSFVTPNMTSDGHDTSVAYYGRWLRTFLEPIMADEEFYANTLILVTFDETETYTIVNRVFSILLGGAIAGAENTTDNSYYNHFSEIATVEANWDLHTLGRWDVGANVFQHVGAKTGDSIRSNTAVTGANPTEFQNSSFAGPFNVDFETAPYPAPNVELVSPGLIKRTVLPSIVETWAGFTSYYNAGVVIPDGQHPPAGYAVNPS